MLEILFYLQANRQVIFLAVMNVDRRHETPRKETKDFIAYDNNSS